jgi:hypothetical protein
MVKRWREKKSLQGIDVLWAAVLVGLVLWQSVVSREESDDCRSAPPSDHEQDKKRISVERSRFVCSLGLLCEAQGSGNQTGSARLSEDL